MPSPRTSPNHLLPIVGVLTLTAACGQETEDVALEPAAAPEVEEIPLTTASPKALAAFEDGRRALDVGRMQEAREHFREAVGEDPEFSLAHLGLADSAASALEFKQELDLARQHLGGKSEGEKLWVEIYENFFSNDAERRIELAAKLVESYPRSPRAWLILGTLHGGLNQTEAARDAFAKSLELDPDLLAAHYALWYSYLFSEPKSFERGVEAMERCLEIAPDEAKCHEGIGDAYRAMGDFERAREAYRRTTDLDPTISVAHLKRGHVDSFLGNFAAAREAYDAGVEGARGNTRFFYANFRAFTYVHGDDPQAALDALAGIADSAAASGLPDDQVAQVQGNTYENMARIALHHELFDEAERILAARAAAGRIQAEQIGDPDFTRRQQAGVLFWESQLAARRGDFAAAEAQAKEHRALLEDDGNPRRFEPYHGLRGLIELRRGNYPEAIEHFQQSNLTDVYVKFHLALAHEEAGHRDKARKLFREVGEWNFNSVGYALVRRDALRRAAE